MASHPALQIFRRYSALNIKSILYYEAELAYLEKQLADAEGEDELSNDFLRDRFADRWLRLASGLQENSRCAEGTLGNHRYECEAGAVDENVDGTISRQWHLMCRIRVVLDDYYQALQRQMKIESKSSQPRCRDLQDLREWHQDPRFGGGHLMGTTEDVWDIAVENGSGAKDYVAAASTGDAISYLAASWLLQAQKGAVSVLSWARTWRLKLSSNVHASNLRTGNKLRSDAEVGAAVEGKDFGYQNTSIDEISSFGADGFGRLTNGLLTVLASALLVVPIVILSVIKNPTIKVGLVFVFTMLMSAIASFGLSMNAEKVLAITTAFAAVQVVFIAQYPLKQ